MQHITITGKPSYHRLVEILLLPFLTEESKLLLLLLILFIYSFKRPFILFFSWAGEAEDFGMDHMVFMGSGTGIIRRQLKHSTMVNNRKFPAH